MQGVLLTFAGLVIAVVGMLLSGMPFQAWQVEPTLISERLPYPIDPIAAEELSSSRGRPAQVGAVSPVSCTTGQPPDSGSTLSLAKAALAEGVHLLDCAAACATMTAAPARTLAVVNLEMLEAGQPTATWNRFWGDGMIFISAAGIPAPAYQLLMQDAGKQDIYLFGDPSLISDEIAHELEEYGRVVRIVASIGESRCRQRAHPLLHADYQGDVQPLFPIALEASVGDEPIQWMLDYELGRRLGSYWPASAHISTGLRAQ
jgi:hypothetical protein